jgi:TRAP-type uncharacterized transport system fused permease subunit
MFVFYYAVLSEVSPPTALSPFAAAAITGGDPYRTTLQAWKYTMPAFLVPFAFVLHPSGVGLLLRGSAFEVVRVAIAAAIGIAALACAVQGFMFRRTTWLERIALVVAGIIFLYPSEGFDAAGVVLVAAVVALQRWRRTPSALA